MLFSVNYRSTHKQEADEIRCPVNQLGTLFDFIKNNPSKRYNIVIYKNDNIDKALEQIDYVKAIAQDYTIACSNIATFRALIYKGYNTYLQFPITDWETFLNLQQNFATDIYIDGPLGFQCNNLRKGKMGIKIRVSPTISPNAALGIGSNANSFFIRPEDLYLYEDVIDIIDFNEPDQDKEDVLFNIYKRGTFDFNLSELIPALNVTAPNLFIRPDFAEARLNCKQRCCCPGRTCHSCDIQFSLTNRVIRYFNKSN